MRLIYSYENSLIAWLVVYNSLAAMSDFFGGLKSGNVRFTDARSNGDGPLPTSLSGPEGINSDPYGPSARVRRAH
jgi:hypothetical protein